MPSTSRRRVLWSAIGLLGGMAGCSTDSDPSTPTTPGGPPTDALTDPPTVRLRNPTAVPVVSRGGEGTPTDAELEEGTWTRILVADAKTATALTFADVDGVDRARRFLDDTDFGAETVYVEQLELGACYERELCWIRWTDDAIETKYASGYRDADVACDADAKDVVADFIRLPVALDPDQVRDFGSSTSSAHCRPPGHGEGKA